MYVCMYVIMYVCMYVCRALLGTGTVQNVIDGQNNENTTTYFEGEALSRPTSTFDINDNMGFNPPGDMSMVSRSPSQRSDPRESIQPQLMKGQPIGLPYPTENFSTEKELDRLEVLLYCVFTSYP